MDRDLEYIASNQSYTNKDFQSIFPELLDLTKKLTNKYDPQLSNESDPLVVLYKLLAFIADKNDYNIDKNVLETFPLSVTQPGNARQLYDSLGYQPHWYRAASMDLYFGLSSVNSSESTDTIISINNNPDYSVKIPAFTQFTDSDGKYVYSTIYDIEIPDSNTTRSTRALQGNTVTYSLNGVEVITLNHLDADLRLYFTDKFVAENGIFIGNVKNSDDTQVDSWYSWERVDNLESYELGKQRYQFGVTTNGNACYIQFPQDIANLIGAGLRIKYISTSGLNGNVPARTIDTFYMSGNLQITNTEETISTDAVTVTNLSSSYTGADPETLEESYRNFKKTIGIFNTLVTLRDYDGAIYN